VRVFRSAGHMLHTSATPPTSGGELSRLQGAACKMARGLCPNSLSELAWYLFCVGSVGCNWPYLQACSQAGEVVIPRSVYVTVLYALTLLLASPMCDEDGIDVLQVAYSTESPEHVSNILVTHSS
jgi:hypothetical protein